MRRWTKIVQIAVIPPTEQSRETIYALCDDGTVWFNTGFGDPWIQVPAIPQKEDKP